MKKLRKKRRGKLKNKSHYFNKETALDLANFVNLKDARMKMCFGAKVKDVACQLLKDSTE